MPSECLIRQTWLKAKRNHICIWCGEVILRKNLHLYRVYRFQGNFMTDRLHEECSIALATHPQSLDLIDDGFEPGSFRRGRYSLKNEEDWG